MEDIFRLSSVAITRESGTQVLQDNCFDLAVVLAQCDEAGRPSEELRRELDCETLLVDRVFYASGRNFLQLSFDNYRKLGSPQRLAMQEQVTQEIKEGVLVETKTSTYQPCTPD